MRIGQPQQALGDASTTNSGPNMERAFALASPHRLSREPADTWDQVAKFGRFVKDDGEGPQAAVFNLEHLGEFMDNFAAQVNPLWADTNHDFGEALAHYDALSLIVDGVPIRTVTRRATQAPVEPPDPARLINRDTGAVEDGLYAHRYELTPLGQMRLPNVSYVSPLFLTEGQDEQGNDVGYQLLNIAWTNGPFLDGMMPLQMMRVPARLSRTAFQGVTMNEWMKRYGIDDKATPEQMSAAMAKYADEVDTDRKRQDEAMSRYRRFADAVGGEEEFGKFVSRFMESEESMSRFRKFMEGEADDDEGEDTREMTAMAKELGVAPNIAAIRSKLTELRFTSVPKTELAALKTEIAELKTRDAKREADEREAATIVFAKQAIADRAWDPDDEAGLVAFCRASPDAARAAVERNKKQKTWDKVIAMQRLTVSGNPVGKSESEPLNLAGDDPDVIEKRIDEAAKKIEVEEKVSYAVAMSRVKQKHPDLYAAFAALRR
jgi:hypothetical protein